MRRLGLLGACVVLTACGGGSEAKDETGCAAARPDHPAAAVAGLLAPASAEVAGVDGTPDRLRVRGFVPSTPADFLAAVRRHPGWHVVFSEREADESEMLFNDSRHSNFWRVRGACAGGSTFEAVVAPGAATLSRGDLE